MAEANRATNIGPREQRKRLFAGCAGYAAGAGWIWAAILLDWPGGVRALAFPALFAGGLGVFQAMAKT